MRRFRWYKVLLSMAKHVVLVGMMGSGKSTVARYLAKRLGRKSVETDALIEKYSRTTISTMFRLHGEAHFRRVEMKIIGDALQNPPAVISLGGGAFTIATTRERLLKEAAVFYLSASVESLVQRLKTGVKRRPLLSSSKEDLCTTVLEILEKRRHDYESAHRSIPTDGATPDEISQAILIHRSLFD